MLNAEYQKNDNDSKNRRVSSMDILLSLLGFWEHITQLRKKTKKNKKQGNV